MGRRRGRKRAIGARAAMTIPMRPNDRWSLDFVADQLTDGRRFRILDNCTREFLVQVADTSLSSIRVARELDRLIASNPSRELALCYANGSAPAPVARTYRWIKLGGNVTDCVQPYRSEKWQ